MQANLLKFLAVVWLAGLNGCLVGCSQQTWDGLDMAKLEALAKIADESGATVELDLSLRPGSAGLVEAVQWDTGVELTARFRWQGSGPPPAPSVVVP